MLSVITSNKEPIYSNGGTILPSRLKELVFPTPYIFSGSNLTRSILPWLPDLTRIRIRRLGLLAAKVLATHCKRLQGFYQTTRSTSFRSSELYRAYDNVVSELL